MRVGGSASARRGGSERLEDFLFKHFEIGQSGSQSKEDYLVINSPVFMNQNIPQTSHLSKFCLCFCSDDPLPINLGEKIGLIGGKPQSQSRDDEFAYVNRTLN